MSFSFILSLRVNILQLNPTCNYELNILELTTRYIIKISTSISYWNFFKLNGFLKIKPQYRQFTWLFH